jgi:4-hydroxy-2-oxoheptanedioate aldolase
MQGTLRNRIKAGDKLLGTFVKLPAPVVVEMLGEVGFDFIIIDLEHSSLDFAQAEMMVTAADAVGMATLIRVPANQEHLVTKALDLGCDGVQVPMVESADQTEIVAQAARYYPDGMRSMSFATRSARFGCISREEHIQQTNANQVVGVQIESLAGVEQADAIAAVEGLDFIFVGPADLSQSMGFPGQSLRPEVTKAIKSVARCAADHSLPTATHALNPEHAEDVIKAGVTVIVYSIDTGFFMQGARKSYEHLKKIIS